MTSDKYSWLRIYRHAQAVLHVFSTKFAPRQKPEVKYT
jgi:hypothetical protein